MKKYDVGISLYKYLLHLKEEDIKRYDKKEAQKDVIYVFNNMDDFKYYFASYGVEVDDDIIKLCIIKTTLKGKVVAFKGLCDHFITESRRKKSANYVYEEFGLGYTNYDLKKSSYKYNTFEMRDNLVAFYPPNDGYPTVPIHFYNDEGFVMNNDSCFSNITNLDDILLTMVKMYDKSLETGDVYNPYGFMLELTDKVGKNYKGRANLICTDESNLEFFDKDEHEEAYYHYMNEFLDHFMGWNFGVSINRNEELRLALEKLNNKVISRGFRRYAGTGLDVYGACDFVCNGLQHYYLPVERKNVTYK